MNLTGEAYWLPVIFTGLMGLAFLIYAMLDGYDLGVGILLPADSDPQRDTMIASIGPFWDANETWLVLGVGILLIAFPSAHSLILYHFYLPVTAMLGGLIMRGVAFDFAQRRRQITRNCGTGFLNSVPCSRPWPKVTCWGCLSWDLKKHLLHSPLPHSAPSV